MVPDTETWISVNGVAGGYIRGMGGSERHSLLSPPWFSLASTQPKGEWDVRPAGGRADFFLSDREERDWDEENLLDYNFREKMEPT